MEDIYQVVVESDSDIPGSEGTVLYGPVTKGEAEAFAAFVSSNGPALVVRVEPATGEYHNG